MVLQLFENFHVVIFEFSKTIFLSNNKISDLISYLFASQFIRQMLFPIIQKSPHGYFRIWRQLYKLFSLQTNLILHLFVSQFIRNGFTIIQKSPRGYFQIWRLFFFRIIKFWIWNKKIIIYYFHIIWFYIYLRINLFNLKFIWL